MLNRNFFAVFVGIISAIFFRNVMACSVFYPVTMLIRYLVTFGFMFKLRSVLSYWLAVSSIIELTRFWVINPHFLSYGSLFPVFLASFFFSGDTFIFDICDLYFFNNNITFFFRPCFTYISPVVDALLLVVIIAFLFVPSFTFIFMCMVTVRSGFGCILS